MTFPSKALPTSSAKRTRLMILDDHQLILSGINQTLSARDDIDIVGSFTSSGELLTALRSAEPDLVIMDYALRPDDADGLNLIRSVKAQFPEVRLIVMSAHHRPAIVSLAMRCGADGFIGKELPPEAIFTAIRTVMGGRSYLGPDMIDKLRFDQISIDSPVPDASQELDSTNMLVLSPELSKREREVLRCCLDGLSVTQIATKFSRSVKTISAQKQGAYKKLGISNDHELFKIREQLENP
ncbi:response regulator [Collimonas sp. NPDC087041]|uniref:response regulator n=1 Tax=Collimonas sp. NPDC087041 TaxID=3363960 RepID=UPI0037F9D69B